MDVPVVSSSEIPSYSAAFPLSVVSEGKEDDPISWMPLIDYCGAKSRRKALRARSPLCQPKPASPSGSELLARTSSARAGGEM